MKTDVPPEFAGEWPSTLDVHDLLSHGWRPTPFREFVLKIHSRCDLACDYCYIYTKEDQSWRFQPRSMSRSIINQAAERIAEHASGHTLPSVKVILHGGEPLLAGQDLIRYAVNTIQRAVSPHSRTLFTIQTNGLRLNDSYLKLFADLGVRVGVSLDGDREAQDRHRKYPNGRGSFARVEASLRQLAAEPYRPLFGGLLCTIDVSNDPVVTYENLLSFRPPMIDFLLPHGNWASPPPYRDPRSAETPYADWLIRVFDRWYNAPQCEVQVRLFGEIMHALLGGRSGTEAIGLSPVAVAVIETDGQIEQSDSLKSAFPGADATGFHVTHDAFDSVLLAPAVAARQIGLEALSRECRACPIHRVCGGGHYVHRYRPGTGFFNPSIYCSDLFKLILHIKQAMESDIAALAEGNE